MKATPEKILVVRLSSIGDIVQSLGVPRHLAKKYPGSHITWVVRKDLEELVKSNPHINEVISFSKTEGLVGWLKLCWQLRGQGINRLYDAHNNVRSHILAWIVRAEHFVRRPKFRLKRFLLFVFKLNFYSKDYSAVKSFLEPLEKWDISSDGLGSEFSIPEEIVIDVSKKIPFLDAGFFAVAPAAAWDKKMWPEESWILFLRKILQETNHNVVILGGKGDEFCKNLEIDANRIINLQGKLTLLESAAVIKLAKTLICADTGLMHMAEAMSKDVISLAGPTIPLGNPFRKTSLQISHKLWCMPCSKDGSGICLNFTYKKCMNLIAPELVFKAYKALTAPGSKSAFESKAN